MSATFNESSATELENLKTQISLEATQQLQQKEQEV